ncbi:MAG TPA: hypothetical protein VGH04_07660 [Gemmatimonadaceae bacterium]|jgi:hypothetical protein
MTCAGIGVRCAICATVLVGCMQSESRTQSAAGDIEVDSLSATRTVLLRVQNSYPDKVRIYTLMGGQPNEIAGIAANGIRTIVLDPNLFPYPSISFEVRPEHGDVAKKLGPFKLYKGETAELVVAPDLNLSRVEIHHSTP